MNHRNLSCPACGDLWAEGGCGQHGSTITTRLEYLRSQIQGDREQLARLVEFVGVEVVVWVDAVGLDRVARVENGPDDLIGAVDDLRHAPEAECISYGELAELQDLAEHIEPGDAELLEWAGVPEEQARAEGRI